MQSVRLHVAGDGEVWALSKCSKCGEVDKHLLKVAATGTVRCRKCGHGMDMTGAVVEAVEAEASRPSGSRIAALKVELRGILNASGLAGAVSAINEAVPHRYTGIFLKVGPLLENVALHDKQNANAPLWAPFPLGQSFCSLVIGSGDPLTVREARSDPRADVRGHPGGAIIQAYCGVPLTDSTGSVLGTLCHFDERRIDAKIDFVEMLQMSALLRDYLPIPNAPE